MGDWDDGPGGSDVGIMIITILIAVVVAPLIFFVLGW